MLHCSMAEVRLRLSAGELPGRRGGGQWRVRAVVVDEQARTGHATGPASHDHFAARGYPLPQPRVCLRAAMHEPRPQSREGAYPTAGTSRNCATFPDTPGRICDYARRLGQDQQHAREGR